MAETPKITIEVDGKTLEATAGQMLIEVTDKAGIDIPRFCYHRKLSVAANCRMCLVDVEKAPKPLPACATPVTAGMKVFTRSERAINAQTSTMELLLINHPLDCPICDQGGECELQDVAMGYGSDVSHYREGKRVVRDKDIGPLIATELTRCIHCTRCTRFGEEVAGLRELGATGRGEDMRIGVYIENSVDSELSGNVIDLCPVGALTAKPSRFGARAWELGQQAGIGLHDCVGSNLSMHTFRGAVNRIVPRNNDNINECWISDRDRFSYAGLKSKDRLQVPMIKIDGQWRETDWQTALEKTYSVMQDTLRNYGAERIGMLVSPNATLEEMFLFKRLANEIKCYNLDHRLRQVDFSHQEHASMFPALGSKIEDLEQLKAVLLVGSNIRKEQPLLAHRLRKAAKRGAKISQINYRVYDLCMPVEVSIAAHYRDLVVALGAVLKALPGASAIALPPAAAAVLSTAQVNDQHRKIAEQLHQAEASHVLIGCQAIASPYYSLIETFVRAIAAATKSKVGFLTDGANSSGAWLMGILPHRGIAGESQPSIGLSAKAMFEQPRNLYFMHNLEIDFDSADPVSGLSALASADFVVCTTPYVTSEMQSYADVLLPVTTPYETQGSFVNIEGAVQTVGGLKPALSPILSNGLPHGKPSQARPAWKVLRVLGNYFNKTEFNFNSVADVQNEIRSVLGNILEKPSFDNSASLITQTVMLEDKSDVIYRCSEVNLYRVDNIVRRAEPLQQTTDASDDRVRINSKLAKQLGLERSSQVLVRHNNKTIAMGLLVDDSVADNSAWTPFAMVSNKKLGPMFAAIELEAD